ncbi:galactosylgalactosylxylosylprotein 3-beta-glucuronosyltransferase 1-like isoform X1 [Oryzias melastigma]|uniref:galactosylgalactosylxylosylprotein 3-beta-glucuronosyltransferase 1-like isoform X1 n=1 Tax=Oryzias melastigma TaxID=30732 RepID=UPI00168CAEC0|nr:galactosylgalactosylxylosylprotein 3-beta-glucuronosyltransferase 1-like isoform X1 [Oryzias melastigma]
MQIKHKTLFLTLIMLSCSLLLILWPHNRAALQSLYYKEVVRTKYVYTRPPPWSSSLPVIYAITPTYSRPVQKAELTRLAHTFLHVPNLHWIVVEDSNKTSPLVSHLLQSTRLNHTHLHVATPLKFKVRSGMKVKPPRGTLQRNLALQWLLQTYTANDSQQGVVYFADDDNTYSLQLFEEMRFTTKVSVWPVAFVGSLLYESPKVNSSGKVYGWRVLFDPQRPFAVDMAGFAVNLKLILTKPQASFKLTDVKPGYQESSLLSDLVSLSDLEPKASNCTKVRACLHTVKLLQSDGGGFPHSVQVLVWHTRTQNPLLRKNITGFADVIEEI